MESTNVLTCYTKGRFASTKGSVASAQRCFQLVLETIKTAYSRNKPLVIKKFNRIIVSYTEEGSSWAFRGKERCNSKGCYTGITGTNCSTCGKYYCDKSEVMQARYPKEIQCKCTYFNIGFEKEGEKNYIYCSKYVRCICGKNCFRHDSFPLNDDTSCDLDSDDSDYFSDCDSDYC